MGFVASSYNTIKIALIVEDTVNESRHKRGLGSDGIELNPFQWYWVRLNLPSLWTFNPCLSWISKLCQDGLMAYNLFNFVNMLRTLCNASP